MSDKPRGIQLLRDPRLNKSTAFASEEREAFGLVGLVPEGIDTEEIQIQRVMLQLAQKPSDLEKYIYLAALQDTDETLFYKVLMTDPARFLPLVYTPTVGDACLQFGHIIRRMRGLYVGINRRGHIRDLLRNWPEADVQQVPGAERPRLDPVRERRDPGRPLAQLACPVAGRQDDGRGSVADRSAVVRPQRVGDVRPGEQVLGRHRPG